MNWLQNQVRLRVPRKTDSTIKLDDDAPSFPLPPSTPNDPDDFQVEEVNEGQINLIFTWIQSPDPNLDFEFTYDTSPDFDSEPVTFSVDKTLREHTLLDWFPGHWYARIRARDSLSSFSNWVYTDIIVS